MVLLVRTDRVDCRGLVVRGCGPQLQISKHQTHDTFLTQRRWNLVLEGTVQLQISKHQAQDAFQTNLGG